MIKKQNKWFAVMLVLTVAILILATGCGSGDDSAPAVDGGASEEPESGRPAVEGERHETETVSMIVIDGWDAMDITGGLQRHEQCCRGLGSRLRND